MNCTVIHQIENQEKLELQKNPKTKQSLLILLQHPLHCPVLQPIIPEHSQDVQLLPWLSWVSLWTISLDRLISGPRDTQAK